MPDAFLHADARWGHMVGCLWACEGIQCKGKGRTGLMASIQSGTSQPDSLTTLAMLRRRGMSASVKSVMAWPRRPARPVRPAVARTRRHQPFSLGGGPTQDPNWHPLPWAQQRERYTADGTPLGRAAARLTYPMDVGHGGLRQVVVDHHLHALEVDACAGKVTPRAFQATSTTAQKAGPACAH
jgi:hypothetical protein